MNLPSLETVVMIGCSRLRNIPVMSTNIMHMYISKTAVEDVPPLIRLCSHLKSLDLKSTDMERITDCIKDLHRLELLTLTGCRRLASLPELPDSLKYLNADACESLETVFCPFKTAVKQLNFSNCFKLGKQARRAIIQQSFFRGKAVLPGRKVPAEFDHRAKGNSLTIRLDGNPYTGFVFCLVISSRQKGSTLLWRPSTLLWRRIIAQDDGYPVEGILSVGKVPGFRTEHLSIFHSSFLEACTPEDSRVIVYEFNSKYHDFDIVECGAKILTEESIKARYESSIEFDQVIEDDYIEFEPNEAVERRKKLRLL